MKIVFGAYFFVVAIPLAGQWLNYPTPGIPRLPDGSANLSATAPKRADGTPDLSGVWAAKCGIYDGSRCFVQSYYFDLAQDLPAEAVRMTPWADGIARQRASRNHVDDPYGYCLPPALHVIEPFRRVDFGHMILSVTIDDIDVGPSLGEDCDRPQDEGLQVHGDTGRRSRDCDYPEHARDLQVLQQRAPGNYLALQP